MKSVTLLSYLLAQHPPWCWNTLFLQCSNTDHSSFSWYLSSHSFSVSCSVSTCYISDSWSSVLSSLSCMCAQSLQSCLTLCNPMDCSLPGFFVHGIFQARKLECHFLLQEIFPTQGSNHISCVDRWIIYPLEAWQPSLVTGEMAWKHPHGFICHLHGSLFSGCIHVMVSLFLHSLLVIQLFVIWCVDHFSTKDYSQHLNSSNMTSVGFLTSWPHKSFLLTNHSSVAVDVV